MNAPLIFDRRAERLHRQRAAQGFAVHDFLLRQMAERLLERLHELRRNFPLALDLGCHTGQLAEALRGQSMIGGLVQMESSLAMLRQTSGLRVAGDAEWLPFAPGSFDLVLSCGLLHRLNDLPGALAQVKQALKPDGVFLAMFPGGETLFELRESLMQAELAETGGATPRVSPFVDVRSAGALLQRAGFALPVADSERLTVHYKNLSALLSDLRGMGETNTLEQRPKTFLRRRTLNAAEAHYRQHYAAADGGIVATFDLVGMMGFKS